MEGATATHRSLRPIDGDSGICLPPSITLEAESPDLEGTRQHEQSDITAATTCLTIKPETPYATWKAVGATLGARQNSACWWLGDWLLFGQRNYHRYQDAIDETGLDYQTLRNYAAVARRFSLSRRRDTLSFQHHAAVSALLDEEQERWLNLAATNGWSLHTLRGQIREATVREATDTGVVVRFHVDATREERWKARATAGGVSLNQWIIETLDAAAREAP